jgi:hypothetical protein
MPIYLKISIFQLNTEKDAKRSSRIRLPSCALIMEKKENLPKTKPPLYVKEGGACCWVRAPPSVEITGSAALSSDGGGGGDSRAGAAGSACPPPLSGPMMDSRTGITNRPCQSPKRTVSRNTCNRVQK